MSDPFVPCVGGVLSADIAVPEHEREVNFYSRVLTTGRDPLWREDLMNSRGMPIIGLGARTAEYADLPLQWMPHIQVADVAASVGHALALGGRALLHGRDDDGCSLWAVLLDPNGTAFGIIPVVPAGGFYSPEGNSSNDSTTRVGHISWLDLTVPDATSARDFYRRVVGWSAQDVEREHAGERFVDYEMSGDDGSPAAGIRHARDPNTGRPPIWIIHLPVGDLAESLRRVRAEGGKVLGEFGGAEGDRAHAVIEDPVGAVLALATAP